MAVNAGFRTWTAGETVTAANVNAYLQQQSIMRFATTAARDSAISSPQEGMTAYIGSGDANEGLYVYDGSNWRKGPGWNAPWGLIGWDTDTSNQTLVGDTTAISNISVAFTAVANRYYKITAGVYITTPSAGTPILGVMLRKGGSALSALAKIEFDNATGQAPDSAYLEGFYVDTPAAGSTTYDLAGISSSGTFTVANATVNGRILVEDIGAAGAPP